MKPISWSYQNHELGFMAGSLSSLERFRFQLVEDGALEQEAQAEASPRFG